MLVAPDRVLTAGHCVKDPPPLSNIAGVLVGTEQRHGTEPRRVRVALNGITEEA